MDKKKLTSVGGVVTAILASTCCVAPLVLAGLGVGAGGISSVRGFGRFHTLFMVLTVVLLGTAFYFAYKKRCEPEDGTACCPADDKKNRAFLWIATGVAAVFLALPFLM